VAVNQSRRAHLYRLVTTTSRCHASASLSGALRSDVPDEKKVVLFKEEDNADGWQFEDLLRMHH